MYRAKLIEGIVDKSNYEKGTLETAHKQFNWEFTDTKPEKVIKQMAESLGSTFKDVRHIERNHFSFSVMEDDHAAPVSGFQKEAWKKGKIDLYFVEYIFEVHKLKPYIPED